jgi:hypothetical protein
MWDAIDETNPMQLEYSNSKWLYIEPKQTVLLDVPVRRDYAGYDLYLKIRFLTIYRKKSYVCMKVSNKIHLEPYDKRDEK